MNVFDHQPATRQDLKNTEKWLKTDISTNRKIVQRRMEAMEKRLGAVENRVQRIVNTSLKWVLAGVCLIQAVVLAVLIRFF